MAHFNFVISQNAKWGHVGFYIDCHRMTVPENIFLQKKALKPIMERFGCLRLCHNQGLNWGISPTCDEQTDKRTDGHRAMAIVPALA